MLLVVLAGRKEIHPGVAAVVRSSTCLCPEYCPARGVQARLMDVKSRVDEERMA